MVSLFFAGCSTGTKKVKTIEEAESFIIAKGFTLENKQQNTNVMVGDRVYKYSIDGINISLLQFNNEKAMNAWADMIESSPIGGSRIIRLGTVAIQIWQGPDEIRQKIIQTLTSE
jgi:hypothetical protein